MRHLLSFLNISAIFILNSCLRSDGLVLAQNKVWAAISGLRAKEKDFEGIGTGLTYLPCRN